MPGTVLPGADVKTEEMTNASSWAMSAHTGHWPGRAPRDTREWSEQEGPSTECQWKTGLWNEWGPLMLRSTGARRELMEKDGRDRG